MAAHSDTVHGAREAAVTPRPDPIFGEHPEERYKALRREIAAATH